MVHEHHQTSSARVCNIRIACGYLVLFDVRVAAAADVVDIELAFAVSAVDGVVWMECKSEHPLFVAAACAAGDDWIDIHQWSRKQIAVRVNNTDSAFLLDNEQSA